MGKKTPKFALEKFFAKLKLKNNILTILFCVMGMTGLWTTSVAQPFNYELKKVVIDAGHGGKDPGAMANNVREKDVNLAIALKLGDYIKENIPGVSVIYTRSTDVFISLDERANIANRAKADLFISIHCNSNGSPAIYGTETYVMGTHKTKENLAVAKRENDVILLEDDYLKTYGGFDPKKPESHIIFSLYQNAHLQESSLMATLLENQFKTRAGRKSRGVSPAGFIVLYKSAMPSILVETGFLTNPDEAKFLKSDEGQSLIASAIYRTIKEYKSKKEGKGDGITTTPKKKDSSEPANKSNEPKITYTSPIEHKSDNSGVSFRIQLYSSYDQFDISKANMADIQEIEIDTTKNGIKYFMLPGKFDDIKKAEAKLELLLKNGFKKASIITYKNNIRQN